MLINEFTSYKDYKKNKNKNFFLIETKKIKINKKYLAIQSNFIKGKEGSFFNFKILYPKKYKAFTKYISCKNYIINLLKKDFLCSHKIEKRQLKEKINYIFESFGTYKLFTYLSHGDLLYFNTIVVKKKTFVFDFEFYKKTRPLYFDFFNWFIIPFFIKFLKLKNLTLISYLAFIYLKIVTKIFQSKNNYFFNIQFSAHDQKIYLLIYLIEKILFYEKRKKIANINLGKSKKQIELDVMIVIFFNKLFNLVKKLW